MAAGRLDLGLFRRALRRLHPDAIEQMRVQLHLMIFMSAAADGQARSPANTPDVAKHTQSTSPDTLTSVGGRRAGGRKHDHAGKNCRAFDGGARSAASRRDVEKLRIERLRQTRDN